jgi:hypothetical protein
VGSIPTALTNNIKWLGSEFSVQNYHKNSGGQQWGQQSRNFAAAVASALIPRSISAAY